MLALARSSSRWIGPFKSFTQCALGAAGKQEVYVVFSIEIFSVYGLTLYNSFGHVAYT